MSMTRLLCGALALLIIASDASDLLIETALIDLKPVQPAQAGNPPLIASMFKTMRTVSITTHRWPAGPRQALQEADQPCCLKRAVRHHPAQLAFVAHRRDQTQPDAAVAGQHSRRLASRCIGAATQIIRSQPRLVAQKITPRACRAHATMAG